MATNSSLMQENFYEVDFEGVTVFEGVTSFLKPYT